MRLVLVLAVVLVGGSAFAQRPTTKVALGVERLRLLETQPNIAGPIAMLSIGAPMVIAGGLGLGYGAFLMVTAGSGAGTLLRLLGGLLATAAAPLLLGGLALVIHGSILLRSRLNTRAAIAAHVAEIDRRLDAGAPAAAEPLLRF